MRRILTMVALAATITIPASVAVTTLGSAGPAFASSSVTCSKLKGSDSGTVTISKCTPSGGKGYKSASGTAATLATGGNITWKSSKATTTVGDAECHKSGTGWLQEGLHGVRFHWKGHGRLHQWNGNSSGERYSERQGLCHVQGCPQPGQGHGDGSLIRLFALTGRCRRLVDGWVAFGCPTPNRGWGIDAGGRCFGQRSRDDQELPAVAGLNPDTDRLPRRHLLRRGRGLVEPDARPRACRCPKARVLPASPCRDRDRNDPLWTAHAEVQPVRIGRRRPCPAVPRRYVLRARISDSVQPDEVPHRLA